MKDGGPAFPATRMERITVNGKEQWREVKRPGMSLRDWFAGQALAGFLGHEKDMGIPVEAAKFAYSFADAMLKARESGGDDA